MVNYGTIVVFGSSAYNLNWTFDIKKKGLEVYKAQDLITNSCNYFYNKLQALYTQNIYNEDNIWKICNQEWRFWLGDFQIGQFWKPFPSFENHYAKMWLS